MDHDKIANRERTGEYLGGADFESLRDMSERAPENYEAENKIKRPHERESELEVTKRCEHCGAEVRGDVAFCAKCGMPMAEKEELLVSEHDKPVEEQNPEIASDGNKLEKEWVERTKKVVNETKSDPREEEIQVSELKADYLKKRFNRAIGDKN